LQGAHWFSPRVLGAYHILAITTLLTLCSWLIDVDRDDEGMQVIADLHGGDPEDVIAKAEFSEIKARVISEVMSFFDGVAAHTRFFCSVKAGRAERTSQCGGDTNDESFWQ
jgi:hypothetical protein